MRKKIYTVATILLLSQSFSQAQVVSKGDKLFGGSFSIFFFNVDGSGPQYSSGGNAGLFPSFGLGVKDNLVMGIKGGISFSRSKTRFISTEDRVNTFLSLGPAVFLKKYKLLKNRFGLYFNHELNLNYVITKDKMPATGTLRSEAWGTGYQFSPGVFYKFSEHFFGEANIGGAGASYFSNGSTENYGIAVSFLQYFNAGISYRVPRKHK